MAKIDDSKAPGFYYVGFVTPKSIATMPPELRERFPLNTAMSNKTPRRTKDAALKEAKAHHLRDITVIKN